MPTSPCTQETHKLRPCLHSNAAAAYVFIEMHFPNDKQAWNSTSLIELVVWTWRNSIPAPPIGISMATTAKWLQTAYQIAKCPV